MTHKKHILSIHYIRYYLILPYWKNTLCCLIQTLSSYLYVPPLLATYSMVYPYNVYHVLDDEDHLSIMLVVQYYNFFSIDVLVPHQTFILHLNDFAPTNHWLYIPVIDHNASHLISMILSQEYNDNLMNQQCN
jgi:hypothetical protein